MIYTKEVAIEQVYLRITGGKPTQQSTVKRVDIAPYLMAAIFWAWDIDVKERMEDFYRAKRAGIKKSLNFDDLNITQCLTPQYDDKKCAYYLELSSPISSLGGGSWEVSPIEGFTPIRKIGKQSDLNGLEDVLGSTAYAYYMQNPKPRIYIHNIVDSCEVQLTTPFNISNVGNKDILPLPQGKEILVIERAVEFFTGQKLFPDDKIVDQADNVKRNIE